MHWKASISSCLLCAGLLLFSFRLPCPALARDITIVPSIDLRGEYNDNINYSRTDEQSDFLFTTKPAITADYRTDVYSVSAGASISFLNYVDFTERNRNNQHYRLSGDYRPTERLQLSGSASYRKDETLESELTETGILNDREDRHHYAVAGGGAYRLSERSGLNFNLSHQETKYDGTGNVDSDSNSISLTFSHDLNHTKDTITVGPYYSWDQSEVSEVDSYGIRVGWNHAVNETWRLNANIGGRHTSTLYKNVLPGFDVEQGTDGFVGDISVQRLWETASASLGYSRSLNYSASGDPIDVDRLFVNGSRNLTTRLSLGVSGNISKSRSEGLLSNTDTRNFGLGGTMNYKVNEDHLLSLGYNYGKNVDRTIPDDDTAQRHAIWLLLNLRFPRKW
ncbi:MAG: outer membrane beta-barrel protein [Deltaproteobacteria bacterium]|nr:outer membrane beta-barrel protein [Deltaproteobacteria bacterium]